MPAMVRRWLIRLPFLLALAFVVGVWIVSYFLGIFVRMNLAGHSWDVTAVQGLGGLEIGSPYSIVPTVLHFGQFAHAKDLNLEPTTFGFRCRPRMWNIGWPQYVFPLWLPTLLLAGLNWFVWRKTREKGTARGFPVEVTKKADQ